MGFFDRLEETYSTLKETYRDKTRDDICDHLQSLGIDAQMVERSRAEEKIECGGYNKSLGMIVISKGPIRWINVVKRSVGQDVTYVVKYGVPDPILGPNSPEPSIRSVIDSSKEVLDLKWEGKDSGGIVNRLNNDILLKQTIIMMRRLEVNIRAHSDHGCWIISTNTGAQLSVELWNCNQRIARHLLAEWPSR